ncbi:hypothetical protein ACMHYB_13520 [Sorangium sp. So ce1128]
MLRYEQDIYQESPIQEAQTSSVARKLEWLNNIQPSSSLSYQNIFRDPINFDRHVFLDRLNPRYWRHVEEAINKLQAVPWHDTSSAKKIESTLDKGLIKKQTFPIFETAASCGSITDDHILFASAYILTKIVPLQITDSWIDYSISPNLTADMLSSESVQSAWTVSNSSIYMGISLFMQSPSLCGAFEEALPHFVSVSQAMSNCYQRRFNRELLDSPELEIDSYFSNPISRLLGSVFFGVSVLGSMRVSGDMPSMQARSMTKKMRGLRQIVDEVADWREDLVSGELTLPYLFALNDKKLNPFVREAIIKTWQRAKEIIDSPIPHAEKIIQLKEDLAINRSLDDLKELMILSGSFNEMYSQADHLWNRSVIDMDRVFEGKNFYDLFLNVALKRAFLERLKAQDWEDVPLNVV